LELASIYEQRDKDFIEKCKKSENPLKQIQFYEFAYNYDNEKVGTAYIYKSVYFEEGEIAGIVCVIIDMTQQQTDKEFLRKKNFELSLALQKDHLTK